MGPTANPANPLSTLGTLRREPGHNPVSTPAPKPRVLLVDDHPLLLQQAIRLLTNEFEVAGTLPDGSALLAVAAREKPDVIVLDIALPGQTGLNLATQLREARCPARVVFLSVHCDADYAQAGFSAGACGYVVKARMASDLVCALRSAQRGERFVSPCPELAGIP
jgi:DNA-binding NarL/FixJ family response regulator